jgi:hypothetical protein
MVNNSININKVKNPVSSQLLEHKDNHSIIMELEIRVLAYINYILFEIKNTLLLLIIIQKEYSLYNILLSCLISDTKHESRWR